MDSLINQRATATYNSQNQFSKFLIDAYHPSTSAWEAREKREVVYTGAFGSNVLHILYYNDVTQVYETTSASCVRISW